MGTFPMRDFRILPAEFSASGMVIEDASSQYSIVCLCFVRRFSSTLLVRLRPVRKERPISHTFLLVEENKVVRARPR
jgi:hypothetical protein